MDKGSGFALVPIFVIVFLACAGQAAAPVSPPNPDLFGGLVRIFHLNGRTRIIMGSITIPEIGLLKNPLS